MQFVKALAQLCGCVLALLFLSGCGGVTATGPKVSGSVKMDGKPLADAMVQFFPQQNPQQSANGAKTDANGRFVLSPHPKTGMTLKPGKYNVYVTKFVTKDGKPVNPEDAAMQEASGQLRNLVPPRYNSPDFPPLKAEIPDSDTELSPIELTSK